MAEFSKQFVKSHMGDWTWDFDIEEEFDKLVPGEIANLICEGYGFVGIVKQFDGSKWFLFRDKESGVIEVRYNDIIN